MIEYVSTITSKGRLALPAAVRRQLGLAPGNRVSIVIDDQNGARLRRLDHDVASVRGVIPTPPRLETDDFDTLIEEAMADHADTVVRRMSELTW
ncbi:MAG: AbrB/MazE/SpoVT family DNA-binding domain-containing protein [Thermomicrobiales bacterium]